MIFQIGDKVRFIHSTFTSPDFFDLEGEVISVDTKFDNIKVKIVGTNFPGTYTIGLASERLEIIVKTTTQISEKSCQICSRKNNTDATVCWWCGNRP